MTAAFMPASAAAAYSASQDDMATACGKVQLAMMMPPWHMMIWPAVERPVSGQSCHEESLKAMILTGRDVVFC